MTTRIETPQHFAHSLVPPSLGTLRLVRDVAADLCLQLDTIDDLHARSRVGSSGSHPDDGEDRLREANWITFLVEELLCEVQELRDRLSRPA